jgi:hypothetical protein
MTTLLPVISIINRVSKGEIVAIKVEHSSTTMHGPTTHYTRYVLATVAKANRQGLATRVMMAGHTHSLEAARLGEVFALKIYQTKAKLLAEATKYPGVEYETRDDLKAAILAME